MAEPVGTLLLCQICGMEVKVADSGNGKGIVRCCGQPMVVIKEQQ